MAGIGDSTLFPNSKMAAAVLLGQSRFRSGEITSVQPSSGGPVGPGGVAGVSLWLSADGYDATTGTWTATTGPSFSNAGAGKPLLNATAINSKPAVKFTGTHFLTGNYGFSDDYFTVFFVGRQTTGVDNIAWIAEQNGTATGQLGLICGTVAAGRKYGVGKFGVATGTTNGGATVGTFEIVTFRSVGTPNAYQLDVTAVGSGLVECIVRQNGTLATGGNGCGCGLSGFPMVSPGVCCIGGAMNGTTSLLNGEIAEIIVYKKCLSNWEIVQIEAYLATKYAIAVTKRPKYSAEYFDGWTVQKPAVLTRGAAGSFDVKGAYGPSFVYDNGVYYLVYAALDTGSVNSIGLATGPSLTSLTKYGQILVHSTGGGWDSNYISGDRLYKDPVSGKWYLFYFGGNAPGFEQPPAHIGVSGPSATPYGPWTNAAAPIIMTGSAGAWDAVIVYRSYVIYEAGVYYLYYNAKSADNIERIGVATASAILGPWTKYAGNPIVLPSAGGTDSSRIGDPVITKTAAGHWVMHYFGAKNPSAGEIYLAESTDLLTWTKYASGIYLRTPGLPNSLRIDVNLVNGVWQGLCDDGDVTNNKGDTYLCTGIFETPDPLPVATATFDPATTTNVTLSNSNLTATHTNTTNNSGARVPSAIAQTAGKYYFEMTYVTTTSGNWVGLIASAGTYNDVLAGIGANTTAVSVAGWVASNNTGSVLNIGGMSNGTVVGVAVDLTARLAWFRNAGGNWNGSGTANPATGVGGVVMAPTVAFAPVVGFATGANDVVTGNFGAAAYANAAPSGFVNWPTTAAPITFTTWNPADKSAFVTLSNGNLTFTGSNSGAGGCRGLGALPGSAGGKAYWEYTYNNAPSSGVVGIALSTASLNTFSNSTGACVMRNDGSVGMNNTFPGVSIGALASGNIVGVAVDLTAKLIWFCKAPSGNWNGSGTANPATGVGGVSMSVLSGTFLPIVSMSAGTEQVTANFGASAFNGAVPSGFTSGWPVS